MINDKCLLCFYNPKIQSKPCSWFQEYTTYTNADERIENCEHFLHVKDVPLEVPQEYIGFPKDDESFISDKEGEVGSIANATFRGRMWNLWEKIVNYLKENSELNDEKLYDVLTAWLFASYVPEVWNTYPYLYLYGISGTGKTRLLNTLNGIAYKGMAVSSITTASLFRTVSKEFITLFIDEYRPFMKGNPTLEEINQILDCGYKKGGQVIRTVNKEVNGKSEFVTQTFNVCGFKALDSTEMIPQALLSRSIFVRMTKSFKFYSQEIDAQTINDIKEGLEAWRTYALENKHYFNNSAFNTAIQKGLFECCNNENRLIELFYPLYRVAPATKKTVILDYLKEASENFENSETVSFESQVFEAFLEAKDLHPDSNFVATKDITDCFNNHKDPSEREKSRTIADVVRSLGFSDKRTNQAYGFKPDSEKIDNLKKRYRITKEERKTPEYIDCPNCHIPMLTISENPDTNTIRDPKKTRVYYYCPQCKFRHYLILDGTRQENMVLGQGLKQHDERPQETGKVYGVSEEAKASYKPTEEHIRELEEQAEK
jgi:hypothetical protein